jgi:hypothetical protein
VLLKAVKSFITLATEGRLLGWISQNFLKVIIWVGVPYRRRDKGILISFLKLTHPYLADDHDLTTRKFVNTALLD